MPVQVCQWWAAKWKELAYSLRHFGKRGGGFYREESFFEKAKGAALAIGFFVAVGIPIAFIQLWLEALWQRVFGTG